MCRNKTAIFRFYHNTMFKRSIRREISKVSLRIRPICIDILIYVEKNPFEVKYNSAYVQLKTIWTCELIKSLQYTSNNEAVFFMLGLRPPYLAEEGSFES